jgi:hypothetical protein
VRSFNLTLFLVSKNWFLHLPETAVRMERVIVLKCRCESRSSMLMPLLIITVLEAFSKEFYKWLKDLRVNIDKTTVCKMGVGANPLSCTVCK